MSETNISIPELKTLLDARKVIALDVRTITEFEEGHLWDSLHRPIDELPKSVESLPKDSSIVTICNKGGGRSEKPAEVLRNAGWINARWLEGGYLGWIEAGFPDYEPGFASS